MLYAIIKTAKANEQLFKTIKTILKNINLGLIRHTY